ncbi:pseudouridine synthase [Halobacteriales archaeon QS_5_70_15]|nr:MAG: pseudouridine synthase [Halobacteriales archaeon QS_5_70_15]
MDERERERERRRLRTLADYQFGRGAGRALFGGENGDVVVRRTSTGRPQQVLADGDRLISYGTDGRFTLGAFAKFVADVDPAIRPGDEVLVVHERGDLLAVGRAELPGGAMRDFGTGMAVKTREGIGDPDGTT